MKATCIHCVLDRLKDLRPIYIDPIQFKLKFRVWQHYLQHTPSPWGRGVHGANKTSSNELQRLFARSRESLPDGYTSHDFVTTRHTCVITTALQPSTSIYRGLIVVPKVESTLSLNPHSLISTGLSVRVPAGTHTPSFQEASLTHSTTTQTTTFIAPTVTFWSSTTSGTVCGKISFPHF